MLTNIRESQKFEDDTESTLTEAFDSFIQQFETQDGGVQPGTDAKENALEDEEQEQIVKQKRG